MTKKIKKIKEKTVLNKIIALAVSATLCAALVPQGLSFASELSANTDSEQKNIYGRAGDAMSEELIWTPISADFSESDGEYTVGGDGNNFIISNQKASTFSIEVDIKILEGDRASILYGAVNSASTGSAWRGVELLNDNGTGKLKAFNEQGPQFFFQDVPVPEALNFSNPITLKVTMDDENKLTVFVNGNEIASATDASYTEGYIGLLTYNTRAVFSNFNYNINPSDVTQDYRDKYRPQLHFSPLYNFMNDPNGLVYDPSNQTYHMFFQYNPTGMSIGNQVWAHAESTDLINWTQIKEIAIAQDDGLGAIFSGSAVVDENNTSGFFTDNLPGESKLVAIFTHSGGDQTYGLEKQSIAYSKDHGHTWTKPTIANDGVANPVIKNENDKYGRDFRDPKVFWYDDQWVMVIAGGRARIFTSPDLKTWVEACDMEMNSECPDLYPLPVDGDPDNIKWVFAASGRWYTIGTLEKAGIVDGVQKYKYTAETDRLTYNGGPNVYATQSFYNDGSNLNRRMSVSWLQDYTGLHIPDKPWNGAMTLPYVTEIVTVDGQLRLTSYPIDEINAQRTDKIFTASNESVNTTNAKDLLSGVAGNKYDIEATFTPGTATEFGFKLRKGIGQETIVKYNKSTNRFILDRTNSADPISGFLSNVSEMEMKPLANGQIKMRIIVDTTIIEAFGNDGVAANGAMFMSDPDSIGMEFFTNGSVTVNSMDIYDMKSIWYDDTNESKEGVFLSVPSTEVEVGETVTINSNILPLDSLNSDINWAVEDPSVFQIISESDSHFTLKALEAGTSKITAELFGTDFVAEVSLSAYQPYFNTNLTGWSASAGEWQIKEGYFSVGTNGDAFAFSNSNYTAFVYEADATPNENGGCPGLVFGATNPASPKSGTWYGANIDVNGNNVTAKLFKNTNGQEEWQVTKPIAKIDGAYNLKVEVTKENLIRYWVNDELIGERTEIGFSGGALGLVTWNSSGLFDNVIVTPADEPQVSQPTSSDTSQPTSSETSTPGTSSSTSQPTASSTSQPTASDTSQPTASSASQPTASSASQPTASDTSQPTASSTSQPTASDTSQPTASSTSQPTASSASQPTASSTSQPTASSASQPTASSTSQPTASSTSQPTASSASQPAASSASQSASSNINQTANADKNASNPKTGDIEVANILYALIAAITAAAMMFVIRNNKKNS